MYIFYIYFGVIIFEIYYDEKSVISQKKIQLF